MSWYVFYPPPPPFLNPIQRTLTHHTFIRYTLHTGTIELLRRVVKQLNWKFSNLKQCSECDYVWFGPPVSRNLILDDDFLDLRKYPSHRSSKMPGMSQAMTKSEFSRDFR